MTARLARCIASLSLVVWSVIPAKAGIQDRDSEFDPAQDTLHDVANSGSTGFVVDASTVYSTSPQPGLIEMNAAFDTFGKPIESYGPALQMIRNHYNEDGRRAAFLLRGDIDHAVLSTLDLLMDDEVPDRPSPPDTSANLAWLYFFLGSGSTSPTPWILEKIVVQDDAILIVYNTPPKDPRVARTADSRPYLYWAPLGELPAGGYIVRLLDAANDSVTFERIATLR